MSHFTCTTCGVTQVDSPHGYIGGCCHHPPEHSRFVKVWFGDRDHFVLAYHHNGAWYRSFRFERFDLAVYPVRWEEVPEVGTYETSKKNHQATRRH